jgi:transposase-like protein
MITYAKAAKKLAKKLSTFEKRADKGDWIDKQTSDRVQERIHQALATIALNQVEDSGNSKIMEGGGLLPVMQAGSILVDWLGANRAINQMEQPEVPIMQSPVNMNKNVNISTQLSEIQGQQAFLNKQADQVGSQSARFAGKAYASGAATHARGEAYGKKIDAETELTNREKLYNHYVNSANVASLNNYNQSVLDFMNQRVSAHNMNNQALSTKTGQFVSDIRRENVDKQRYKDQQALDKSKVERDLEIMRLIMNAYPNVYGDATRGTSFGVSKASSSSTTEQPITTTAGSGWTPENTKSGFASVGGLKENLSEGYQFPEKPLRKPTENTEAVKSGKSEMSKYIRAFDNNLNTKRTEGYQFPEKPLRNSTENTEAIISDELRSLINLGSPNIPYNPPNIFTDDNLRNFKSSEESNSKTTESKKAKDIKTINEEFKKIIKRIEKINSNKSSKRLKELKKILKKDHNFFEGNGKDMKTTNEDFNEIIKKISKFLK